jgi:hypothetical protein
MEHSPPTYGSDARSKVAINGSVGTVASKAAKQITFCKARPVAVLPDLGFRVELAQPCLSHSGHCKLSDVDDWQAHQCDTA